MYKNALLSIFAFFFAQLLPAQSNTWHKLETSIPASTVSFFSAQMFENDYWVFGNKSVSHISPSGELANLYRVDGGPFSGAYMKVKKDAVSSENYLLVLYRGLAESGYTFAEFRQGKGFVHESKFSESSFIVNRPSFPVVELNDSAMIVVGRSLIRKLTHRPGQGVVQNWQAALPSGEFNCAVRLGNGQIMAAGANNLIAINESDGAILWQKSTNNHIFDLKTTNDGVIACGISGLANSSATLNKFTHSGDVVWQKNLEDKSYYALLVETNGAIMVTGNSQLDMGTNKIVLRQFDADGNTLWRKTFNAGLGKFILKTSDGGYFVLAHSIPKGELYHIKTDEKGNAPGKGVRTNRIGEKTLENNRIASVFQPNNRLFFDGTGSTFSLPKDSATSTIFAAALWVGGKNPDDLLSVSANTYANNDRYDFRPGHTKLPSEDFSRVWAIKKSDIQLLRSDWADNGKLDLAVPEDIRSWPAKGNEQFRRNPDFSQTTSPLDLLPAPFVDANQDGRYNIADGDYPLIKGDAMAWWIFTDDTTHRSSQGQKFPIDVIANAYMYLCDNDDNLSNTLFIDFSIKNESTTPFKEVYAGLWADPDLGCFADDLIGSLPQSDAYYFYNADAVDGQPGASCDGGLPTFGDNIPVQSVQFVNHTLNRMSILRNTTPSVPGGPSNPVEYYNVMRTGYSGGVSTKDTCEFPGNPATPGSNSDCSNPNLSDKVTLAVHGPFSLKTDEAFELHLAFTFHPDIEHPCPDIFGKVKSNVDDIRQLDLSGQLASPKDWKPVVILGSGQSATLNASVPGAKAYYWSNGETTATINSSEPGIYTVTITRSTTCTDVETVVVKAASGIKEVPVFSHIQLFPNPNNGGFTVALQGQAQAEIELALFNLTGQLINTAQFDFSTGSIQKELQYEQLKPGMYILRIRSGDQTVVRKVMVD